MNITDQLKRVIVESGYSSAEIARMAGVSPRIVQRFVVGQRDLTLASASCLAEALDLRLVELARPKKPRRKK